MSDSASFHLAVEADLDPLLPGRLLARLTVTNQLPPRFAFHVTGDERLHIEATVEGRDCGAMRRLASQIGAVATVRRVVLSNDGGIVSLDPAARDT